MPTWVVYWRDEVDRVEDRFGRYRWFDNEREMLEFKEELFPLRVLYAGELLERR